MTSYRAVTAQMSSLSKCYCCVLCALVVKSLGCLFKPHRDTDCADPTAQRSRAATHDRSASPGRYRFAGASGEPRVIVS